MFKVNNKGTKTTSVAPVPVVLCVVLHENETLLFREDNIIRLEWSDAKMMKWMCVCGFFLNNLMAPFDLVTIKWC